jgi:alkanesulfonate monooxygenase SsuD/methylene tetrahydromethanopterin reductase-like flavin-dependent oxidoreductase (luciferase family)
LLLQTRSIVKLDLLYEVDVPKPWPGPHPHGQRAAEQAAYREAIAQIRLADELGFHTSWHVEHHFREGRSHCPAPEVLIGALSQVTERIRLGFGVTLLPHGFTSPVRVAEKVATADLLSNGRVEWGTGRSTPMEQTAFGVDIPRSKDQVREAIQAIVAAWESEYFSFEGEHWTFPAAGNVPVRMVTPKPFQDPHPPVWMAASSDSSAQAAGAMGLGLLSLSIMRPLEQVAQTIALYRRAAAQAKPITRVTNNQLAVYTLVHCADTMAQAEANGIWEALWWWYSNLAEFTLQWEFPHASDEDRQKMFPILDARRTSPPDPREFSQADMIIVGDPDECLRKMLRYAELGVDRLLCYLQFGHLPHASVMRSIELLGTHVIPELARRDVQVQASVTTA